MNESPDGPFDRAGLTEGAVRPLVAIIASSADDALVAQTLRSTASLTIDNDGWRSIDEAVRTRLNDRPAAEVVTAAALIPVVSVRSVVRALADSDDQDYAAAALRGLIEARDHPGIAKHLAKVIALDGWQSVCGLPNDVLEAADLPTDGHDPDEAEPWFSVAHAKAGNLDPLRALLQAIERDQSPPLFWGDPAYIASLLEAARPVPEPVHELLRNEPGSRDIETLVEGLIGDNEVAP